jgi:signal-transduction protein with cAMP-binding, CBS, and nucleotidyltransferase domain
LRFDPSPMTSIPDALAQPIREFLARYAPFDRMGADDLAFVVPRLKLAYFAAGRDILAPDNGPVGELHLIQRGRVGSRQRSDREHLAGAEGRVGR